MSVFGDFQRVWVQRFPDSALPAAWEEDVRANLVKHKQKVSSNAMILFPGEEISRHKEYLIFIDELGCQDCGRVVMDNSRVKKQEYVK